MLNKSSSLNPAKRVANGPNAPTTLVKPKDTFRPTKANPLPNPAASTGPSGMMKLGPTTFRTTTAEVAQIATSSSAQQALQTTVSSTGTITLVSQQPRALGPPSRPSAMMGQHQAVRPSMAQPPPNILQQSRVALQAQMEKEALDKASEEIVLPDIASE